MPRTHAALLLSLACIAVPSSTTKSAPAPEAVSVSAKHRSVVAGYRIVTTTSIRTFASVRNAEFEALGIPQRPASETITLDEIDAPGQPGTSRFNAEMRHRVGASRRQAMASLGESAERDPAWPVSLDIAARVTAVAPGLIAAELRRSVFPHHLMKSAEDVYPLLWSLREQRALTADDLFEPASQWWTALVPAMMEGAYGERASFRVDGYDAIDRSQTPSVSAEGVWMKFRASDSGGFVLAQPILLSWRTVRPYLRKSLPFDPEALTPVPG